MSFKVQTSQQLANNENRFASGASKAFETIKPIIGLKRTTLGDITNNTNNALTAREQTKKTTKNAPKLDMNKVRGFGDNLTTQMPESARDIQPGMTSRNAPCPTERSGIAKDSFRFRTFSDMSAADMSLDDLIIDDIDAVDRNNPQMVTDYVNDIYRLLLDRENNMPSLEGYMEKTQVDINAKMRTVLIDWLIEVHLKFKLAPETMSLTVNILDRFLASKAVMRNRLQLIGCTAMLIAAKYEEIFAPEVRDYEYVSDRTYQRAEFLKMERVILSTLGYDLSHPNALTFLPRVLKAAQADKKLSFLISYFVEITYQHYNMLRYKGSHIAAAATYIGLKVSGRTPWTPTLQRITRLTENDIMPCVKDLAAHIKNVDKESAHGVRKKYSSSKFMATAKLPEVTKVASYF